MRLRDYSQVLLIVVSIALLVSNIFLLYQNVSLKTALSNSKQFITDEGYEFSSIQTISLDGTLETITLNDKTKATFLLMFNTNCKYCLQQYPYWRKLLQYSRDNNINVLALTSESDSAKIKSHVENEGLSEFDVKMIAVDDMRSSRLAYTPMTVFINSEGVVKKVWAGLWTNGFILE